MYHSSGPNTGSNSEGGRILKKGLNVNIRSTAIRKASDHKQKNCLKINVVKVGAWWI